MLPVFITRRIPPASLAPLERAGLGFDIRPADDAIPRNALLDDIGGRRAVVTFLSDRVDEAFLEAAGPELRIVANYAVGYDNVDVGACSVRGVAVSNTPDVLDDATADQAMTLMLAVARRVREGHELAASGRWSGWEPLQLLGQDISGSVLGIVGMGRIGSALARRARGFGMRILYHNRRPNAEAERELGATYQPLDTLLEESDVVSLHCPLTPETTHLIGPRELALMKPTAILVNTARGPVVDEAALVSALREGHIWGAGLDVFEREPRIHEGLVGLPNTVLAPHLGSATQHTRTAMGRLCCEAIVSVLGGETVPHLLNPDALGR